jgi:hypothetical protein
MDIIMKSDAEKMKDAIKLFTDTSKEVADRVEALEDLQGLVETIDNANGTILNPSCSILGRFGEVRKFHALFRCVVPLSDSHVSLALPLQIFPRSVVFLQSSKHSRILLRRFKCMQLGFSAPAAKTTKRLRTK